MTETCANAEKFLSELVDDLGLQLKVSAEMTDEGCMLDLQGEDSHFAHAENGELLDAFETLLFQIYGRQLDREHRFIVDADGYRQTRKKELQAMARFAGKDPTAIHHLPRDAEFLIELPETVQILKMLHSSGDRG